MSITAAIVILVIISMKAAVALEAAVLIKGSLPSAPLPSLKRVPNAWQTLTSWDPTYFSSPLPANFKTRYPFLEYVELFTATGGCYVGFPGCSSTRDLFVDNKVGPSSGYNFTSLLAALRNIVNAGLIPHIVTGNIPIALSAVPHIGAAFSFNSALPRNLTEYREYIAAVAQAVAAEFTPQRVAQWRWGGELLHRGNAMYTLTFVLHG